MEAFQTEGQCAGFFLWRLTITSIQLSVPFVSPRLPLLLCLLPPDYVPLSPSTTPSSPSPSSSSPTSVPPHTQGIDCS